MNVSPIAGNILEIENGGVIVLERVGKIASPLLVSVISYVAISKGNAIVRLCSL